LNLRTSSAANVDPDKDSDKRQRAAFGAFANRAAFTIVGEYYDRAVSGADRIDHRPGFRETLQRLAANGAKTIRPSITTYAIVGVTFDPAPLLVILMHWPSLTAAAKEKFTAVHQSPLQFELRLGLGFGRGKAVFDLAYCIPKCAHHFADLRLLIFVNLPVGEIMWPQGPDGLAIRDAR
jgi:hypothetical protein